MNPQSPQALLARLREHPNRTIIVDFDETLWLRNSTEEYLASLRPAWLAGLLLYTIEVAARIAGQILQRLPSQRSAAWARAARHPGVVDGLRASILSACFPRGAKRWQTAAETLGPQWVNTPLLNALMDQERAGRRIVVSSLGFEHIIAPLLAGANIHWEFIGSRGIADRWHGKLKRLADAPSLTEAELSDALVITDSDSDQDLLKTCGEAWLVRWPEARYARAGRNSHLPLYYTARIKHPQRRYFRNALLQDDYAFWLLALPWTALWPLQALAAGLLLLSFWCIYENGYRENDVLGLAREEQPVLSSAFHAKPHRHNTVAAWVWSLLLAAPGVGLLCYVAGQPDYLLPDAFKDTTGGMLYAAMLAAWVVWLVLTRSLFRLFNLLAQRQRVVLYPALQLLRHFALVSVAALSVPGLLILGAQSTARSVPYCIYRSGATKSWPRVPVASLRLMLFLIGIAVWSALAGSHPIEWGPVLAITAWCLIRARQDLALLRA